MSLTPSPLRRFIATSMATIMATAPTIVPAQTIPRQPFADSTHTYRLSGTPQSNTPVCNAGFVLSGQQCVALNTGAGATVLPYAMPPGTYYNAAPYPLLMQVVGPDFCTAAIQVHVYGSWTTVVSSGSVDASTTCTATGIVPAQSYFWVGDGKTKTRVTALKSGATWEETGVAFWSPTVLSSITYTDSGKDATGCSYTVVTTRWTHNISGATDTQTVKGDTYCPVG